MEIKDLCVSYGANVVYNNFNFTADDKAVTCILGESGCGKTTLLNAIANLIPYSGNIYVGKCSYVFQSHRLIPNLTVIKNLLLVCPERERCINLLKEVGLGEKVNSYPKELSGGEAQRVSLCRAFLYPSDYILMDEPFSSLDLKTKLSVMDIFKSLSKLSGLGAMFVTHDIDEALYLADRITVMNSGKIVADIPNPTPREYGITGGEGASVRRQIIETLLVD